MLRRAYWVLLFVIGTRDAPTTADVSGTPSAEDLDGDGIRDEVEQKLILDLAPEVRLHPSDYTRPANVDWYLGRTSLRFSHPYCRDHEVLVGGVATQEKLSTQKHPPIDSCEQGEFFLHPESDAVRDGAADPNAWRVYAHVKKSVVVGSGFDVQFWFFYPYDFAKWGLNHEGDWEHVTISTDADGNFVSAWLAQHTYGERFRRDELAWNGTHPIVYSAIGTHATYPRAGTWPTHYPTMKDRTADGGPVWKGWQNVVNVGERAHPMNGQSFIRYAGRWGGEGLFGGRIPTGTTAPMTPTFQASWTEF